MKELTYLIKDIKNKDDLFWFKFLEDINRNKFVLEETLDNIFKYFKFNCDICIIESTSEFEQFKCIFKNNPEIDDQLWTLLKRKLLTDVARKNQLQNVTLSKRVKGTEEVIEEVYYIHPILTKQSVYYIIFNKFDATQKHKYALAFESVFCLFQTCEKNDLLAKHTMIDNVTGCYNFNQFQKALGAEIAKVDRVADKDVIFSVILIDIYGFDKINEKYGYSYGDMVLKTVAKGIKDKIRNTDEAYRIGGDEFCVINTYATKEICQEFILPRIQEELTKRIHLKDNDYYIPKFNVAIVQYRKGTSRRKFEKLMEDCLNKAKETKEVVIE